MDRYQLIQIFISTTFARPSHSQNNKVIKTQMAANRTENLRQSISSIWRRGGPLGFYQGLIPWAWIEASTKGGILLFSASEIEYYVKSTFGVENVYASIIGGMGGGICQAYATMGFCTFMKTVEVTRDKNPSAVNKSTLKVAREIIAKEGIRGINKGVNAVAFRQCTNWGSRFGLSRVAETVIRKISGKDQDQKLSAIQLVGASAIGGALSCWNQPIEVIRVEMQSQIKTPTKTREKMTMYLAAKEIYTTTGWKGFFRGISPRMCIGIWQTIFMVFGGDQLKLFIKNFKTKRFVIIFDN